MNNDKNSALFAELKSGRLPKKVNDLVRRRAGRKRRDLLPDLWSVAFLACWESCAAGHHDKAFCRADAAIANFLNPKGPRLDGSRKRNWRKSKCAPSQAEPIPDIEKFEQPPRGWGLPLIAELAAEQLADVAEWAFLRNSSYKTISIRLGISLSAARSRKKRAEALLRDRMLELDAEGALRRD
jgi:hypothetical protein